MKPYQDITDPSVAKALAHPLRSRILAALEALERASQDRLKQDVSASVAPESATVVMLLFRSPPEAKPT